MDIQESFNIANQEIAAFSFAIGHDFRNVVNQLSSFIAMLEQHSKNILDEKGNHYLEIIKERTNHLESMILALQHYGQVTRSNINFSSLDTNMLIQEVIRDLNTKQGQKAVDWKIEPLPSIVADPVLMREAFKIILDNALKFSSQRESSVIKIYPSSSSDPIHIVIEDEGLGFTSEKAERLFWHFQRFHNEDEFPGLGMGLATLRRIMQMHQGKIEIHSSVEGGTSVEITLPQRLSKASV